MPSSNNLTETALIACVAACIGSYLVVKLTQKDTEKRNDTTLYYPTSAPTFLQNDRTRGTPSEEAALQPRGFSMAEALKSAKETSAKALAMTPSEVLQSLQKGNSRFFSGQAKRPEVSAFERRALIRQQFPSIAVLGCSDSRVPVEIVFDLGLGDMFVVRVAGNCLGPTTQASLDYAVHHLNVKVLLVMGHEGCGAIKAARLPAEQIQNETKALATVLTKIKKGGLDNLPHIMDPRASDREAVALNVRHQITELTEDAELMAKVNDGSLIVVGAFYEISSGIVDFFMQVSQKMSQTDIKPAPGVQSRFHPETKETVYA